MINEKGDTDSFYIEVIKVLPIAKKSLTCLTRSLNNKLLIYAGIMCFPGSQA